MRQVYIEDGRVSEEPSAASTSLETLPTGEPEMTICDRCCYPVESEVISKQAVPGGEGETRNVCPDCR